MQLEQLCGRSCVTAWVTVLFIFRCLVVMTMDFTITSLCKHYRAVNIHFSKVSVSPHFMYIKLTYAHFPLWSNSIITYSFTNNYAIFSQHFLCNGLFEKMYLTVSKIYLEKRMSRCFELKCYYISFTHLEYDIYHLELLIFVSLINCDRKSHRHTNVPPRPRNNLFICFCL
jgi:hypothetical protein